MISCFEDLIVKKSIRPRIKVRTPFTANDLLNSFYLKLLLVVCVDLVLPNLLIRNKQTLTAVQIPKVRKTAVLHRDACTHPRRLI